MEACEHGGSLELTEAAKHTMVQTFINCTTRENTSQTAFGLILTMYDMLCPYSCSHGYCLLSLGCGCSSNMALAHADVPSWLVCRICIKPAGRRCLPNISNDYGPHVITSKPHDAAVWISYFTAKVDDSLQRLAQIVRSHSMQPRIQYC